MNRDEVANWLNAEANAIDAGKVPNRSTAIKMREAARAISAMGIGVKPLELIDKLKSGIGTTEFTETDDFGNYTNSAVTCDDVDAAVELMVEAAHELERLSALEPTGVSVEQAAQVLLDAIPQRHIIAERVHQNTDASSVGTIELALMHALKDLGYPTPPQGEAE